MTRLELTDHERGPHERPHHADVLNRRPAYEGQPTAEIDNINPPTTR